MIPSSDRPFLRVENVTKRFGSVPAIDRITINIERGQIHAIVGENGAGKSTLINILAGVLRPDAGDLYLDGAPVRFPNPHAARAAGISVVYQELSLIPELSVAENIYLHREPVRFGFWLDRASMDRDCEILLDELDIHLKPEALVEDLSIAQRQLTEIARALSGKANLVIMDEPTASLTSVEEKRLFRVLRRLRDRGVAILYVSHRLEEIFDLADEVSVFKDGQHVSTMAVSATSKAELIRAMVGRELAAHLYPAKRVGPGLNNRPPALDVRNLSAPGRLHDVSLRVLPGEIVGLGGLVGSGRTSLLRAIFAMDDDVTGTIEVGGESTRIDSPKKAIELGLAFVSEDRKEEGLALSLTVLANLAAPSLAELGIVYRPRAAERIAIEGASGVELSRERLRAAAGSLSGGNQQKVCLGRWLPLNPKVLLCDEPTRGIDVGAKAEIYRLLRELANGGMAIIFASSELPELLGLSDRILVMADGRIAATLDSGTTEEEVMHAAANGRPVTDQAGVDSSGASVHQ